jgi:hypothetical protein
MFCSIYPFTPTNDLSPFIIHLSVFLFHFEFGAIYSIPRVILNPLIFEPSSNKILFNTAVDFRTRYSDTRGLRGQGKQRRSTSHEEKARIFEEYSPIATINSWIHKIISKAFHTKKPGTPTGTPDFTNAIN